MYIPVCIVKLLMQPFEEVPGLACLYVGQARNGIHRPAHFQHIAVHTAATVTVAIGNQSLLAQLLIPEFSPASYDRMRSYHPVVGGETLLYGVPHLRCVDKISHYLGSVDSPPLKQVIRNAVILVPANLGCHEGINLTLLQYLRQRPAISEHVRQPQVLAFASKFLL